MMGWVAEQLVPHAPGFWLLIGLLTTSLLRSLESALPRAWRLRLWAALWVLVPYLGLLSGGLSPRLMGLSGSDWSLSLGLGVGIAFGALLLLGLVRALLEMGERPLLSGAPLRHSGLGALVFWSGITQFYWAFLRGGVWELLLTAPQPPEFPGYWAVWIAAALIAAQILWARPAVPSLILQLATLLTTSILFFYSHNFWLCWAFHAALQFLAAPALVITPQQDPAPDHNP